MVIPAATRPVGRYLLFGQIASGGKATVHLGRLSGPARFGRIVAIKRLHAQYEDDPDCLAMFLDEARLAARIHHPNVVPTLDVVQSEEGLLLVMEYVHGASLAKLAGAMREDGSTSDVRVVAAVMSGVLRGLHAAHEAKDEQGKPLGIVHRDVSPQNILVGADGVPRVLDFGVAKAFGRVRTRRQGHVKGKLAYMAPERLQNQAATRSSDVYAAAVVTWELLTGQPLFANSQSAILTAVLQTPLKAPSEVAAHVPPAFDRVVLRGLERDPASRYQTALEMALDLEQCADLASATDVGEWVESLAHDELLERSAMIAEIENSPSGQRATPGGSTPQPDHSFVKVSTAPSAGVAPVPSGETGVASSRRRRVAMITGVTVLLAVGAVLVVSRSREGDGIAGAASPSDLPSVAAPDPSLTESATASDTPPEPSSAPSPTSPPPARRWPPPPTRRHAAPQPNCDPPYTFDKDLHKIYKPGCF